MQASGFRFGFSLQEDDDKISTIFEISQKTTMTSLKAVYCLPRLVVGQLQRTSLSLAWKELMQERVTELGTRKHRRKWRHGWQVTRLVTVESLLRSAAWRTVISSLLAVPPSIPTPPWKVTSWPNSIFCSIWLCPRPIPSLTGERDTDFRTTDRGLMDVYLSDGS